MKRGMFYAASAACVVAIGGLTACGSDDSTSATDVVKNDANIAHAIYSDSLSTAQALKTAIDTFVATPDATNFAAAKTAWLAAREPYGQTEVYRFRLSPIDSTDGATEDGAEGQINGWPLGEAIIDYVGANVDGDSGPEATAASVTGNIIADATTVPNITKAALAGLNEDGGDGRNVATGYHAIEFLLWGQDQNTGDSTWDGTAQRDSSAGQRPVSDFNVSGGCTSGTGSAQADTICTRRGQYLVAATELLIDDLAAVVAQWDPSSGSFYASYVAAGEQSLAKMMESMGRLSFGELAGERINIALKQDSQEDEHSCFSDNTHRDIYLNAKGVQNSFLGSYKRVDGSVVSGSSVKDYMASKGQQTAAVTLEANLATTMAAAQVISDEAVAGTPFDRQIQQGGINDAEIVAVIQGLTAQTKGIEDAITALNLSTGNLRQDTEEDI